MRIKDETMTREFRIKIRESGFAAYKKRWRGKGGLLLTSKKSNISNGRDGYGYRVNFNNEPVGDQKRIVHSNGLRKRGGGGALAAWDYNEDVTGNRGQFSGQPFEWNQIRYSMFIEVKDHVG